MATFARINHCQVDFSIFKNGELAYQHNVEDASEIKDNDMFYLTDIGMNVGAQDEIYLAITSPDAASGNAVTVWMFSDSSDPEAYVSNSTAGTYEPYHQAANLTLSSSTRLMHMLDHNPKTNDWFAGILLAGLAGLIAVLGRKLLPERSQGGKNENETDDSDSLL